MALNWAYDRSNKTISGWSMYLSGRLLRGPPPESECTISVSLDIFAQLSRECRHITNRIPENRSSASCSAYSNSLFVVIPTNKKANPLPRLIEIPEIAARLLHRHHTTNFSTTGKEPFFTAVSIITRSSIFLSHQPPGEYRVHHPPCVMLITFHQVELL